MKEGRKEMGEEKKASRVRSVRGVETRVETKNRSYHAPPRTNGKRDKRFLYDFTSMLVKPFFKTVFYIYIIST